mgnify:CR=1 FL=1
MRIFASNLDGEAEVPLDPLPAVEARSTLRRVREHLDAIDPVKAWTMLLHDVGGYDLKEIADITGASVSAAQTRLVRGRAELQRRIEADADLVELLRRAPV